MDTSKTISDGNTGNFESPEWHKTVLDERERKIQSGEAQFIDWEQAKDDIRKQAEWRARMSQRGV